jgi:hypothetical protein
MKQVENKSGATSAKKTAQISIKQSLIAALKKVAGKFGTGSDKLEQEIEKGSKKLAKKIVKEIKLHDAISASGNKDNKIAKAPEKPAAEIIKDVQVAVKPKAAAPKKKETPPATAAKPAVVKPAAVKKEKAAAKK